MRDPLDLGLDGLLEDARAATDLDDFGDPSFREGLAILLETYEAAGLRPGGRKRTRRRLLQLLANRLKIETVFYRAFTQLLPSNATFAMARTATIQAALDLYGAGSPAERAVTEFRGQRPIRRAHNQTGIHRYQEDGGDHSLGAEPQLECGQKLSNGLRGHNEKSPKIAPNLPRFAYDRLNGHNSGKLLRS